MTHEEAHRLAIVLESLRGSVDTGFATVRGDINLLARAERSNSDDIKALDGRVSLLEGRRFPLPTVGGIMGVAGVCVSVLTLFSKGG